jgi:hypothetical protein
MSVGEEDVAAEQVGVGSAEQLSLDPPGGAVVLSTDEKT